MSSLGLPVRVLFLEKVFLRKAPEVLRGVELFNLALIRDLLRLGHAVEVPADATWRTAFGALPPEARPQVRFGAFRRLRPLNTLVWGAVLSRRRFDVMLLGNVGHNLIPLVRWLWAARAFRWQVLVAHRETSPRFLRSLRGIPGHIVAVNGKIAEPFRAAGFPSVQVDYGVMDGERFFPGPEPRPEDAPVRFGVVGMLDNAWKGADTAVAAFRAMPDSDRARCELHLASFSQPPAFPEPNILPHPWMPAASIPDWLRTLDAMLCPSRDEHVMRETFSQAMVQGMLTGLPVLASDLPIFREKLDRGGGATFTDAEDLARQMSAWVRDPEGRRRRGREARATALERYVWDSDRFASRYLRTPPAARA